jgi:poly(A) polymerase
MKKYLDNPILSLVSDLCTKDGLEAYVIGGYVRDCLLGRPSKDIDIVVVGSGIELAKKVINQLGQDTKITVFKNFGTAMIKWGSWEIEFVGARKESYRRNSRKPVVENGSLEDDLRRRDFTINSMAISLHANTLGQFIDPYGGKNDLEKKRIRTPLDPKITFDDDPLRMLRAIRFVSQLGFHPEKNILKAIQNKKDRISIVSFERIIDEINKILLSPKPSVGFRLLEETGLLDIILPELQQLKGVELVDDRAHKDNFYHTLKVVDNISRKTEDLWLRWAALLHDIAKPQTKKFDPKTGWTFHGHDFLGSKMIPGLFRKLKLPLNEKMKFVQKMVELHLRPIALVEDSVTDSAVRRLLFEAGDDIDSLMILCEADITSKNETTVRKHMHNFRMVRKKIVEIEEKDAVRNFQPPIRGEEIMEIFHLPPSRTVGILKNAIKDAILDGKISNKREEAMNYLLKTGKEMGLKRKKTR